MLQPGTVLDNKYRIESAVGRGGFGYVYRARERLTGETVAVKELVPSFVDDRGMVQRFIQEARATLRLTHTYIARSYTIFEDRGTYYLAMEYLSGGSLADRLASGPLPVAEAVQVAQDLCRALAYAHDRGVVHCDIKPANVLFDEDGAVRLADFGIAHVSAELMTRQFFTATGTAMGTVRYMAPEQLEGVRDDPRVDIYAVGALLYEMLAGRPYLDFETESTPLAQANNIHLIRTQPARPLRGVDPRLPAWLAEAVERALRKAAQERFATAKALREALEGRPQPQEAEEPLPPTQLVSEVVPEPAPADERMLGHERAPEPAPDFAPAEERRTETPSLPSAPRAPAGRGLPGGLPDWLKDLPIWGYALGGLAAVALLVGGGMWLQRVIGGGPATPPPATEMSAATSTLRPTSTRVEPTPAPKPTSTPTQPPPTERPLPTAVPTIAGVGETWRRPADDAVMVYVPGGEFEMGSTRRDDEQPVHTVALDAFWIDKYEVTNAQYARCVADGDCEESRYADDADFNGDDYPVVGVDWYNAAAYCEWAGARLPTEAEWEYAARGPEGHTYPWGDGDPTCDLAQYGDCSGRTVPVGSLPDGASWCAALDLAGSVWEWVADWYGDYPSGRQVNPTGPPSGEYKVLRGGSWYDDPGGVRGANRNWSGPGGTSSSLGFRCARGSH
jgi:formylglycine-generating enzyme required for sulfatase activity/serine/threonine protein kinase